MQQANARKTLVAFAAFALAMAALIGLRWGYDVVFVNREAVWTRVDDAAAEPAPDGDSSEFTYTLAAYDVSGARSEVTFGTQRRLRDGAYLKLETLALRGVVSWEEVAWGDIPAPAQAELPPPAR